jgi:hypothetical protein
MTSLDKALSLGVSWVLIPIVPSLTALSETEDSRRHEEDDDEDDELGLYGRALEGDSGCGNGNALVIMMVAFGFWRGDDDDLLRTAVTTTTTSERSCDTEMALM